MAEVGLVRFSRWLSKSVRLFYPRNARSSASSSLRSRNCWPCFCEDVNRAKRNLNKVLIFCSLQGFPGLLLECRLVARFPTRPEVVSGLQSNVPPPQIVVHLSPWPCCGDLGYHNSNSPRMAYSRVSPGFGCAANNSSRACFRTASDRVTPSSPLRSGSSFSTLSMPSKPTSIYVAIMSFHALTLCP